MPHAITTAPAQQRIIVTPAPNAVFVRIGTSVVEATPGEALRLIDELRACVTVALGVEDGRAVLGMVSPHNSRNRLPPA